MHMGKMATDKSMIGQNIYTFKINHKDKNNWSKNICSYLRYTTIRILLLYSFRFLKKKSISMVSCMHTYNLSKFSDICLRHKRTDTISAFKQEKNILLKFWKYSFEDKKKR